MSKKKIAVENRVVQDRVPDSIPNVEPPTLKDLAKQGISFINSLGGVSPDKDYRSVGIFSLTRDKKKVLLKYREQEVYDGSVMIPSENTLLYVNKERNFSMWNAMYGLQPETNKVTIFHIKLMSPEELKEVAKNLGLVDVAETV